MRSAIVCRCKGQANLYSTIKEKFCYPRDFPWKMTNNLITFSYDFNGVNIKCIVFLMVTSQFLFFSWNPCAEEEVKAPNSSCKLKTFSELHIKNQSLRFLCFLQKPNYISLWFCLLCIWVLQDVFNLSRALLHCDFCDVLIVLWSW